MLIGTACNFGHDREVLELRWKGLEAAATDTEHEMLQELIRLVYGKPPISPTSLTDFKQYFRNEDPTFLTTGNDQEVLVLAGCTLAILLLNYDYPEVAQIILTTSLCGTRKNTVTIDLIGMAKEQILKAGISARKRPLISAPKLTITEKTIVFDTLENLAGTATEALKTMGANTNSV